METHSDRKTYPGKAAVLADAKSESWTSADYKDLKVTVFDHTAIATGTFVGHGKDTAGRALDVHERFTDTWIKMTNGSWLCVASHTSELRK